MQLLHDTAAHARSLSGRYWLLPEEAREFADVCGLAAGAVLAAKRVAVLKRDTAKLILETVDVMNRRVKELEEDPSGAAHRARFASERRAEIERFARDVLSKAGVASASVEPPK